jgi:quaternary ammonium compound-resistance protein SugE
MIAWVALFIAGLFETGWAVTLKYSAGFTKPGASLATLVLLAVSMVLLGWSVKTLPIGSAYAVWTGIGAIGAAVLGIALFNESASPARLICIGLIVAGVIGLKLTSPS